MHNRPPRNHLFTGKDGFELKRATVAHARAEVARLSEARILNTDPEALTQYLVETYSPEVPTLHVDRAVATPHERNVEVWDHWEHQSRIVPGTAFDFEIPFSGTAELFNVQPAASDGNPPEAEIRGDLVCFSVSGPDLSDDKVRQAFESTTATINKYLQWHQKFWTDVPAMLANEVRAEIDSRRERLLKHKQAAVGLASLGVKLKEKTGDARTFVPAAVKQKLVPQMPPMRAAVAPEPTLDNSQYETILGLIRDTGRSIEQCSSRARELDEQALRDILLVPLNAHFGKATGEAFNYGGKTDILIRHEGKNLFVAECKVWHGEKQFLEAIDQLLGYLTWRDTKTVLIIFNRNENFSDVVRKLASIPAKHSCCVSATKKLDETTFQFLFRLPRDAERQITLSVMGFDLGAPVPAAS